MQGRRRTGLCLAVGALATLFASAASAQMPPDIVPQVKAIGRVIDVPGTAKIYAPLHPKEPYAGVKVERDLKYGPDARHALDVFTPESATAPLPVFIFIHGGGFVAGNKRGPNASPFYDNFMLMAARNEMVGVNATYRLAPANKWPSGAEDVAAAVKWVQANIAQYGGDPARIFLVGSSAGGAHVAGYVANPKLYPKPDNIGLKGVLLLAGTYDFEGLSDPGTKAYFGDDASKYAERSPLIGTIDNRTPMFVSWAELDPPGIVRQSQILYANLCNKGRCPAKLILPNHSHISTVYAVNTDDKQLENAMMQFIKGVK
jgi:acetyl esterase/lipase